ncbi:MAG: CDP-glycerol glycerophosphotransferase family protein [Candidatus Nitrosopelagicus sp.]|nr:CDP-glycerol glycerophosphotransferase family protein [Candidatus Nitrosopelagicus sp.]
MKFNFSLGKEWSELKKFEKLSLDERSIVFYAENKASINHFRQLILELTEEKNFKICYVTSVKDDPMLFSKNKNILTFHIGDGSARIKFFLTLKAKILIMDMPDLETFHIKRSKVHPVHYIYIFHSMFSIHSYLRKGAIDNYDTIFCVGEHHKKEIKETEKVYGLKPKKLITYGFSRLDTLLNEKQRFNKINTDNDRLIIIAPSYGNDNLLEICGEKLLEILLKSDFKVLLRPHFRTLRDSKKTIKIIEEKFGANPNFTLEKGIIPPEKFQNSKCMISDWSGISFEYAFTFERPVIFIDVPKKVLNPDSGDISLEPIEISIRDKIGYVISPKNLEKIPEVIENITGDDSTKEQIIKIRSETVYNLGKSAKIGAEVIERLHMELN